MRGRDPGEEHRTATTLELFFDLCFVVAVSQASIQFAEQVLEGHAAHGLAYYAAVFFAIWWAWMGFSWFASAYDTDDVPYRLAVFVQMAGALVLAAGVPEAFAGDFTVITIGYAIMRISSVSQWIRAAVEDPDPARARVARRYAIGISVLQAGWIGRLWMPEAWQLWFFIVLVAGELLVPVISERDAPSAWHPEHIAERFGLFTLIVLGETVKSATIAVQHALDGAHLLQLSLLALGGLLTVFTMWWMYFARPNDEGLVTDNRQAFRWGYGHYLVLGSAAAVGTGLEIGAALLDGHGHISAFAGAWVFSTAVAVFVTVTWLLHVRPHGSKAARSLLHPAVALLVLLTPFTPEPYLATGLLMTVLLALSLYNANRTTRRKAFL
ncbi:low temperature requirement protein A [Streptomyces sp. CB00455]|uniref:low temperature requirement protein A n=1 Tax=Streptomyces sp. CB00455 TaxID=1703927 RepID=UPI000D1AF6EA|nr:low temperature requirement protein A [Streptomyces sp. CB00455]